MTTDSADRPLDRRFLIRGGAVLAGAAGATALGAALAPTRADAANGDPVALGQANAATDTTAITIDGSAGGADPTLRLNNANGPSLALQALPEQFAGDLRVGEIANTVAGPFIGVNDGGAGTTFLATGADLANTYPVGPARVMDTRSATDRRNIVGSSTAPFDSAGRLKAGAYIDVAVGSTPDAAMVGVFVNVTAFQPTAGGFVEVYTPGRRPALPTARYERGADTINSALVAPGFTGGTYTVRVYTSRPTHVLIDVTGIVITFPPVTPAARAAAPNRRLTRQAKQRARLVTSVRNR